MRKTPVRISRAAFIAMWNDPTLTTTEIAAKFGIHRSSVTPYGQRLGLPRRKDGAKRKVCVKTFTALWLAGVTTADIAVALHMSQNYTGTLAANLGLPQRRKGTRDVCSLDDYRASQMRAAMADTARREQAAAKALWRAA